MRLTRYTCRFTAEAQRGGVATKRPSGAAREAQFCAARRSHSPQRHRGTEGDGDFLFLRRFLRRPLCLCASVVNTRDSCAECRRSRRLKNLRASVPLLRKSSTDVGRASARPSGANAAESPATAPPERRAEARPTFDTYRATLAFVNGGPLTPPVGPVVNARAPHTIHVPIHRRGTARQSRNPKTFGGSARGPILRCEALAFTTEAQRH
jgi:hypothetical protein